MQLAARKGDGPNGISALLTQTIVGDCGGKHPEFFSNIFLTWKMGIQEYLQRYLRWIFALVKTSFVKSGSVPDKVLRLAVAFLTFFFRCTDIAFFVNLKAVSIWSMVSMCIRLINFLGFFFNFSFHHGGTDFLVRLIFNANWTC